MSLSKQIENYLERSSWIRKMFEEGLKLKKLHGPDKVFDLSLGNPDLPPPVEVKETLKKLAENYNPDLHRYMPNAGFPEVREIMAKKVSKEQGINVSSNEIIMTCGAAGALNIIFKTILDPGDEVIFPSPFFVEYFFYVENHQGKPIPVRTQEDFSLDLQALERAITPKTKAVLINSPNNPTGQVYTSSEIEGLANLLKEKGKLYGKTIYLVSDEPYRNLIFDKVEVPSIFKYYSESFVAYSFSKELSLAGERIGFVAVHPEMSARAKILDGLILANRILGFVNAPALAQRIVAECAFARVAVEIYKKRRDLLCSMLEEGGLEFVKPKGSFFMFPKVPMDDVKFCEILKEELILAVPGRGFGVPNHIRLAFCVSEDVILKMRPNFLRACERAKEQS
ncbi:aspartate aminotransferase [Caldimicrobium thiodismutans]|uniref:Aminotransferase n=1 Tax=Caldimicrobium thiodismutans TaxID=1653476 RepID=A0A0U5BZ86_9BACT|nr:pyridoxal phosphate-dependent aminotransferase [Caldimicrobium thiodismutans]BAU24133.1 aspartate aminotransferase [Caldimicrobium thiodismutans]